MAGILTFDAETFKWLNKAKSENKAQKLSEESFHVKEFCSRYKQQRNGKKVRAVSEVEISRIQYLESKHSSHEVKNSTYLCFYVCLPIHLLVLFP